MIDYTFLIPVHNEEKRIASCLQLLTDKYPGVSIVVAEDGSNDATVEIARKYQVKVVICKESLGQVGGIRNGLQFVDTKYVIIRDVDLLVDDHSYDFALALLRSGSADLVAGKRWHRNEPLLRIVFGNMYHALVYVLFGLRYDTQCGFKAAKVSVARQIYFDLPDGYIGFAYHVKVYLNAEKHKHHIVEIPVSIYHFGDSSVHLRSDIINMFKDLMRIWWNS